MKIYALVFVFALGLARAADPEIEALREKANALDAAQKFAEALPVAHELLALRQSKLGAEHLDVARSLHFLGALHEDLGQFAEAEPWYRQALAMREKLAGEESTLTAQSVNALGWLLGRLKRYDEAEPMLTRALGIRERVLGPAQYDTAWSVRNLGRIHVLRGDAARGEPLLEQGFERLRAAEGAPPGEVELFAKELSDAQQTLGHWQRRAELSRRMAAEAEAAEGRSFTAADWWWRAGVSSHELKQFAEARGELERALAAIEVASGPEHAGVAKVLFSQGKNFYAERDFPRALAAFTRCAAIREKIAPAVVNDIAEPHRWRAFCQWQIGQAAEAEQLFRVALAWTEKHPRPDGAAVVLGNLAEFYKSTGAKERHIETRARLLAIEEQRRGAEAAATLQARRQLGDAHAQAERWAEAARLHRENLAPVTRVHGAQSLERAQGLYDLGWAAHKLGRAAESEASFREGLAIAETASGAETVFTLGFARTLAIVLEAGEQHAQALELYERVRAVRERTLGAEHEQTLESLRDVADELESLKRHTEAIPLRQRVLATLERRHRGDHDEVARALRALGWVYRATDDFEQAARLYERAYAMRRRILGDEHLETIDTLQALAFLEKRRGALDRAAERYEEALAALRRTVGEEHAKTLDVLEGYSDVLLDRRDFEGAEKIKRARAATIERLRGAVHDETIDALTDLAAMLGEARRFAEAQPLYERALMLREELEGADAPGTAQQCCSLAWCLREQLRFAEAEPLLARALAICRTRFGEAHPRTAECHKAFGYFFNKAGDHRRARESFQQWLAALEKFAGADSPALVEALKESGLCSFNLGEFAAAREAQERALGICARAWGEEHVEWARCATHVGGTLMQMGDFAGAAARLDRALVIFERALGSEHSQTVTTLTVLAMVQHQIGSLEKAESLYRRATAALEKTHGPEDAATAAAWMALAAVLMQQGRGEEALGFVERAVASTIATHGREHPQTAAMLAMRGLIFTQLDRSLEAFADMEEVVRIRRASGGPSDPGLFIPLTMLAVRQEAQGEVEKARTTATEALELAFKSMGDTHPSTLGVMKATAALHWRLGEEGEARQLSQRHKASAQATLANVLAFTSEQERLRFLRQQEPFDLLLHAGDAPGLAEAVLRWKGIVLDSLLEDRLLAQAAAQPERRTAIERIRAAKQRLFESTLSSSAPVAMAEREALTREIEREESALARAVEGLGRPRGALVVTPAQVSAALPPGTALVEFLRARRLVDGRWVECYAALVLAREMEPRLAVLGDAEAIDAQVRRFRKAARGQADETTLRRTLTELHGALWQPVERLLPEGTGAALISPDGELSFVSFAALLDVEGRFVAERFRVSYVASGRDLLRALPPAAPRRLALFAAPDFARGASTPLLAAQPPGELQRDLADGNFPPLPGAAREAAALESLAAEAQWPVETFDAEEASEQRLAALAPPRVLHLATHGFLLPEILAPAAPFTAAPGLPAPRLANPMHRAGLALAGAQATLEAWRRGEAPPSAEDGLLTAEEVGGLDLRGTWLVALSACDTAGGEARAGEGVLGLRRGFVQAGARNLLLTLWPISDETTVAMMRDFYERALASGDAPGALAQTQREWLVKLRAESGLLHAVQHAGAFILSSQGQP